MQAADEAGRIEIAAEHEVVVAGMAGGVGLAAVTGALIGLPAVAAEIMDAAVDQALHPHPVRAALDVGDGADPHVGVNAGEAGHANRARAIGAFITRIAVRPGIAVDAVQDRAFRKRGGGATGDGLLIAGAVAGAELLIDDLADRRGRDEGDGGWLGGRWLSWAAL